MKLTLKLGIAGGLVVVAGLVAMYVASSWPDPQGVMATPVPQAVARGNYERYTYAISDISGENKKLAQFDPSLPTDETVVLGALRAVARDGLGVVVPPELQPAVENRAEVNYVTFVVGGQRIWFELFRNTSGQVGTARFWTEPL